MSILVAGGTGYIGSHTVIELLEEGKEVIVIDNFSNSNHVVLDRIKEITNKGFKFYNIDIIDSKELEIVFKENKIDSVIHFAAYKAVGESVEKPLEYYTNNIVNTLSILNMMKKYNVKNFVFSSLATVYGDPHTCPILENFPFSKPSRKLLGKSARVCEICWILQICYSPRISARAAMNVMKS